MPLNRQSSQQAEHVQTWWDIFMSKVQRYLTIDCSGICAHLAKLSLTHEPADGMTGGSDQAVGGGGDGDAASKRRQWEIGQIDYLGGDGFESIQKKLDEKLSGSK